MTQGYRDWISYQIPCIEMRTICTAFIQVIIIALVTGFIFEYCIINYDNRKQEMIQI